MSYPVLIAGGGIAGITAALELAEAGQEVILVEKEPYLGGNVSRFHTYFPKLCPPSCGLEINYRRIRSNPRVAWFTGATLTRLEGEEGNFEAILSVQPQLVNDRCTACGNCAAVCPEQRIQGPGQTAVQRAAYIPPGITFPMKYTIDETVCLKQACGKCLQVCEPGAIELEATPGEIRKRVRAVIVATGWQLYDASRLENYRYRDEPDVVTNLEFEQILENAHREQHELTRPSDGRFPERIAFIQCAGSRDLHHLPYCSSVCCSASIKHVLTLAEKFPRVTSEVFYIDLRLTGRNEKLLTRVEKHRNITLTKGKVGKITRNSAEGLVLEVEDVSCSMRRSSPFDMVVLAMGIVPNHLPLGLPVNADGFYLPDGSGRIVPAGSSKRPMDVASTVRDATSAALKTMQG
jgi:quinone-modifying oxidoreductase subunit QmoA